MTDTLDGRPRDDTPVRPRLAPAVTVDAPLDADGSWIIASDGVPRARVSSDVAAVAVRLTGECTVDEVAAALGEPWTPAEVVLIADRLGAAGLLDRGARRRVPRGAAKRLRFRPPLTLQWSFGDPHALFSLLRPLARFALGAPGAILAALVLLGGIVAAVVGGADAVRVLAEPVTLPVVIGLAAAIVLTTVLHEIGHGAALSAFGGSPRRIGAMLFYLAPAFFCDVTDGWRLGRRTQRVVVALAGPAVHLLCGAVAVIAAVFVSDPTIHALLVLYALSCLVIALLNLVPFVQLDGYLALMAACDHPHLRRHAMEAARDAVLSLLGGADRGSAPATGPTAARGTWLVTYGILCRVFPVLLVGLVLQRFAGTLAGLGPWSAAAYLATLVLVAAAVVPGAVRGIRALIASRPRPLRAALVGLAAAVVVTAVLLIPVQTTHRVGVVAIGSDVRLAAGSTVEVPSAGTPVDLEGDGILLPRPLGNAVIGHDAPVSGTVDIAALVPVEGSGLSTPATLVALAEVDVADPLPPFSRATFADPDIRTVGGWLWQTYVGRPLGALVPGAQR